MQYIYGSITKHTEAYRATRQYRIAPQPDRAGSNLTLRSWSITFFEAEQGDFFSGVAAPVEKKTHNDIREAEM